MNPERRLGEWYLQTKLLRKSIFNELSENYIFMDDGATPVEYIGTPAGAQNLNIREISKLLCAWCPHSNIKIFKISKPPKHTATSLVWHMHSITHSFRPLGAPKSRFFARASYKQCFQNCLKMQKNPQFQNITEFEVKVAWMWHTHQNDGQESNFSIHNFVLGMRTSGTPEISTNQPCEKNLKILLWKLFGARRAVWRAVPQIFPWGIQTSTLQLHFGGYGIIRRHILRPALFLKNSLFQVMKIVACVLINMDEVG